MKTVILHRQPHKPNMVFSRESDSRAEARVNSLCDLHNAVASEDGDYYHVWAADYYEPPAATYLKLIVCGTHSLLMQYDKYTKIACCSAISEIYPGGYPYARE